MNPTLTISVSPELLAVLNQQAAAAGKTPEALAADTLASSIRFQPGYGKLRRLAGSLPLGDGNVASRVDEVYADAHFTIDGESA